MDEGDTQDNLQENPPTRNISTAPAFSTAHGLESVQEEDENLSSNRHQNDSSDGGDIDKGDEADDEMVDVKRNELRSSLKSPKLLNPELSRLSTFSSSRPDTSASQRGHSPHKTISRASSRKSRASRQDSSASKAVGQSSDSESDMEEVRQRDSRTEFDMLGVDITNEKDWDTDLETEEPPASYDHTGRTTYIEACTKFGVVPASYFLRHMNDSSLTMKHHGLAGDGMKAISASLISNATIQTLDISDNWLGYEGGMAVCEMLKENCFITDLNVSDNHLSMCAERLCQTIEQNDTLRRVNLSGNDFDDQSAIHLADLIMNTTKLESLNLSHNNLGEQAGILLGPAISENLCLKELDLSWNHLRRKGAVAVAAGVKNNVYMKKVNLSWNGFGLEGSTALMDALKTNNVLEEMDIMNNRITTEGAVMIGKGVTVNETLKVLKIGKNPMQSAGCWAIAAAILKNPNCILESVEFSEILVNKDFVDILKEVEAQFPSLKVSHGGSVIPSRPRVAAHPLVKMAAYITSHNIPLMDFFKEFDKDGSMSVSREEFKHGISETGVKLTDEEMDILVEALDTNGDGCINYSGLVGGHSEVQDKGKRIGQTVLRPMTS